MSVCVHVYVRVYVCRDVVWFGVAWYGVVKCGGRCGEVCCGEV